MRVMRAHPQSLGMALLLLAPTSCASIVPIAQPNAVVIYQTDEFGPPACEQLDQFRIVDGRSERGYEEDGSRKRAFSRLRRIVSKSGGNAAAIGEETQEVCLDACAGSQYHIRGNVLKCPPLAPGIGDDEMRQLAAAKAKWAATRPTSYTFWMRWMTFAADATRENVLIRVDGPASRYFLPPMAHQEFFDQRNTVDKLFDVIEQLLEDPRWTNRSRPPTVLVQYDAELGYPHSFRIDPDSTLPGDEIVFLVYDFVIESSAQREK